MGNLKIFDDIINQKLLDMHTAYLAKVLSTDGKTATVQPLGMFKEYGGSPKAQAPVSNVPIIQTARYNKVLENITYVTDVKIRTEKDEGHISEAELEVKKENRNFFVLSPLAPGNLVVCVCCDRDITDAKKGANTVPAIGHHSLSDSVIVGIL